MDTGNQLRLSGEGAAGENGAPAGDLYVVIHVKEHHIFERDGNNPLLRSANQFLNGCVRW